MLPASSLWCAENLRTCHSAARVGRDKQRQSQSWQKHQPQPASSDSGECLRSSGAPVSRNRVAPASGRSAVRRRRRREHPSASTAERSANIRAPPIATSQRYRAPERDLFVSSNLTKSGLSRNGSQWVARKIYTLERSNVASARRSIAAKTTRDSRLRQGGGHSHRPKGLGKRSDRRVFRVGCNSHA